MPAYYREFPSPTAAGLRPAFILRPMARVQIVGPNGGFPYEGDLDTGAAETLLPWEVVDRLGVRLIPGRSIEIAGIGGSVPAMFGWVDFEFLTPDGPIRWSHLAVFGTGDHVLFGLRGFLEYFVARFDGVRHEIRLLFRGKAPAPRFLPPAPRRSK
jgi:hypothetical protein